MCLEIEKLLFFRRQSGIYYIDLWQDWQEVNVKDTCFNYSKHVNPIVEEDATVVASTTPLLHPTAAATPLRLCPIVWFLFPGRLMTATQYYSHNVTIVLGNFHTAATSHKKPPN